MFPFYLAIGMTDAQYWDGDSQLVIAYRKAEEIRLENQNRKMWVMGAYIYDAMLRVSPAFRDFTKRGTRPKPYPSEPYSLTEKQEESRQEEKQKITYAKGKRAIERFMEKTNKKFEGK